MKQTTKAHEIDFKVNETERYLIRQIVERAQKVYKRLKRPYATLDAVMDIKAVHCNGNAMRLEEWLRADDFNFMHDIDGIRNCLDRKTGKLTRNFSPWFTSAVPRAKVRAHKSSVKNCTPELSEYAWPRRGVHWEVFETARGKEIEGIDTRDGEDVSTNGDADVGADTGELTVRDDDSMAGFVLNTASAPSDECPYAVINECRDAVRELVASWEPLADEVRP